MLKNYPRFSEEFLVAYACAQVRRQIELLLADLPKEKRRDVWLGVGAELFPELMERKEEPAAEGGPIEVPRDGREER